MLLTSVNTIKIRLARAWIYQRNMGGPFVYKLSDQRVINNKPHVTLKRWIDPRIAALIESGHEQV